MITLRPVGGAIWGTRTNLSPRRVKRFRVTDCPPFGFYLGFRAFLAVIVYLASFTYKLCTRPGNDAGVSAWGRRGWRGDWVELTRGATPLSIMKTSLIDSGELRVYPDMMVFTILTDYRINWKKTVICSFCRPFCLSTTCFFPLSWRHVYVHGSVSMRDPRISVY